jgi:hypothetical protein
MAGASSINMLDLNTSDTSTNARKAGISAVVRDRNNLEA